MKLHLLMFSALLSHNVVVCADDNHATRLHHQHSTEMSDAPLSEAPLSQTPLTEAGNDTFGTIQEVIARLNSNPDTDWSKVDIEALREHLVDMNDMTLNVEVISQKAVPQGLVAIVKPTAARSAAALKRVFSAHPAQLKRETDWDMQVEKTGDRYMLTTTTVNPGEVNKIRGLGYIGLMAAGSHHQRHHWAMAKGENPHAEHK